jgi:hypothetical protein
VVGWLGAALLGGALTGTLDGQVRQRITQPVDSQRLVRLRGTTHPLANAANDRGRVAPNLAMERILLVLKSSPEQEAALEQLLAEQQDPASPHYREWLTPQQFGERFGPSQEDLDVITTWLQGRGFQVNSIAEGRRTIEFSGTAREVEETFQTEIHHYEVNGERHVANATDIAIPEALGPVAGGLVSLHDFPVHPLYHRVVPRGVEGLRPGSLAPAANLSGGGHAIAPYDFATIYNVAALWSANRDGTGQTIAIPAHTNIKLSDVTNFRSFFGLPANNPTILVNGADPGIISADEETEADLDVEWSGAVAKGATVELVVSKSTRASDGIDLSSRYIVNQNLASVISLSFGACEAQLGSGNAYYNGLWQQAAAQGISVFVAAGDTGSAGCDVPVAYDSRGRNITQPASQGLAVNGLASTPYNVAVGGTEFNDGSGSYWSGSANATTYASALGYIPEVVWNESSYTTAGASGNNLYAGSGGVSILYGLPAWQTGNGVPTADPGTTSGHHRYLPDVSLSAAGHDGYIMEQEGVLYLVGGTSVSSPAFAGIMAIVNQYTGMRNGNPNLRLYLLAAQAPSVFHDVTSGTNAVPCAGGSPGCSATAPSTIGHMNGYSAGTGYDLATGWGSVNASSLASNWSNVTAGPTIISLNPNPMTESSSSQTLTIAGSGFQSGLTVQLSCAWATTVGTATVSGSTQIQVPVTVGTTAGACTVKVVNPNNQASNTASLQVVAPAAAPAITSLSPNPMTGSSSYQALTIAGTGFQAGLTVALGCTGTPAPTVGTVTVSGSTSIQALVIVGATPRTCTVQVVNPNKLASNTASLQVAAPAAPVITSLSPNPMTGSNSAQVLTINGSGFQSGSGLKVVVGYTGNPSYTATLQGSQIAFVSGSQILALITVGTTARTWSVQVVNPNGVASAAASLTVVAPPPPPVISSVSPNPMTGSNSNQTLTINGSGFQSGNGLTVLVGYTGYTAAGTQVKWVSSSQVTATINVGTSTRTWLVEVINPNGQVSNVVTFQVNGSKSATR